ncbi:MAG: WD40 repeat domain-containing protein [Acetobacteraceae bacterium]|nr:WD40 repeat domain-containing protein [Acetobacteraceae bacterium]
MLAVPIAWVFLAIPFVLVRWLSGASAFSASWRAGLIGAVIGLVSIPFAVEMGRLFTIDGPNRSFLTELALTLPSWPHFAAAGAVGGLVYWLIEYSSLPPAVVRLFVDSRPLPWTNGLISRRVATGIAAATMIVVAIPVGRWWWRPHVYQLVEAGVPPVAFEQEWESKGWIGALAWSSDSTKVTSASDNGGWLAVRDIRSGLYQERKIAQLYIQHAIASGQLVIAPEEFGSRSAFNVFSAKTGTILHEEPDPAPGKPPLPGAAVRLAMTADGSMLAVGYDGPRAGLPVFVLSTRDWRVVSALNPESDPPPLGVQVIAFSEDGKLLAVGGTRELLVCNVATGVVVNRIPIWANAVAFSPDNRTLAVAEAPLSSGMWHQVVHLIRLPDGAEMVSRQMGSGSSASMLWDPRGRFIVFASWGDTTVRLWNPSASPVQDVTIHLRRVERGMALSPDGSRLALANGGVVSVFKIGE